MRQQSIFVKPESVALPKNRKRFTTLLILIAILCPPWALYLDGASGTTVMVNFLVWLWLWFIPAIIWAVYYVLRPSERRKISRPARYRLWVRYSQEVAEEVASTIPPKASHS